MIFLCLIIKLTKMQSIFILFLLSLSALNLEAQSLKGSVIDSANHQPIQGATIHIPQLKLGATSDIKGDYKFSYLPSGNYEVIVRITGYATITKQISVTGDTHLNFEMAASFKTLKEVLITSLGYATTLRRAPVPVNVISNDMLVEQSSNNVIDAIAKEPGLNEITEGPGISKPEINGLGYNRVLTLFDGERQEDFQWGDEHGILIDPNAVYDAEIIRGPASLQYGANAVAGVVSFKPEPFADDGSLRGSVSSEYQTNDGLIANSVDIGGNHKGLVWNIRGSYETDHCYKDPKDGFVWGTAYEQSNLRAVIGLNRNWGYSRLSISVLHRRVEVPDGNRDSLTGQFEFDFPQNGQIYPDRSDFLSYKPVIAPDQILDHDELWWQNSFKVGNGNIGADIGYTQSIRHEIDSGSIGVENLIVHDIPYSFKYLFNEPSGLKLTTGLNGMYEFENNYPEPPAPYIGASEIPNYNSFDIGGFGIVEKSFKNLTMSGGLRYDFRTMTGQSMYLSNYNTPEQQVVPGGTPGAYQQYAGFTNKYSGLSGSIGASYQLPGNNYVKINFAKSFRAPSIDELNSNSLNSGANAYILGYTNLKAEQGYEADIAYGYNGKDVNFELDGFYNHINHFIFQDRLASLNGGDSLVNVAGVFYPVFQYQANSAIITGATAYFNIHPASEKWLEIDNGFTYIYSFLPHQTDSTQYVPLTPAPRLTSKIRLKLSDRNGSVLRDSWLQLGAEHDWEQNRVYSALYTELPSLGYTLYNAGIGTRFINPKTNRTVCSLFLNCTNLFNLAYVDHLSHAQYFWAFNANPVTVTQRDQGIYNMGRNLGLKVIFPIGSHKVSDTEINGTDY